MKKTTNDIGIRCPKCRGKLRVIRTGHAVGSTVRRLVCCQCGHRTNSIERLTCDALTPPTAISSGVAQVAIGQIVENAQFLAAFAGLLDHVPNNQK